MSDSRNSTRRVDGLSRRAVLAFLGGAVGVATFASSGMQASANEEISHTEESIHQETTYKANRKLIYEAIMDAKQFDKIIQMSPEMRGGNALGDKPTQISRDAGGAFVLFGGHIVGRNVELVPNQRIVQAWRVVDWAPGHYSMAKFELVEEGSGTRIVFDHTGFPKGQAEHLAQGWKAHYWDTLKEYLG